MIDDVLFAFLWLMVLIYLSWIPWAFWKAARRRRDKKEQEEARRKEESAAEATAAMLSLVQATKLIKEHQETLQLKRKQLIRTDDYGVVHSNRWEKEKQYFTETVLGSPSRRLWALAPEGVYRDEWANRMVDGLIEAHANQNSGNAEIGGNELELFTSEQFEQACARVLEEAGWTTKVTSPQKDQGVDILAELNGVKVAVQAKLYSNPVGNKAVQEVVAGRHYYQCNKAVVVTSSSFTQSAQDLARMNDVTLLHFSQLHKLTTGIDD
jgi:restriction system protein